MKNTHQTTLLVFVPEMTSRVEYAFEFIFQTILGASVVFTNDEFGFLQSDLPKINYSPANLHSGLFLKAHSILFEKNITDQKITGIEYQQLRLFFPSSDDSFLPFDPFACSFYLLTRYEEYLSKRFDEHERFSDSKNLLVINGLHQKPVVDLMAYRIAEEISNRFPEFEIQKRAFHFVTTIDVDNAWAFKNKNLLISAGAALKAALHLQFNELKERAAVSLGLRKDPYDTYTYILETFNGHLNHILFFFLMGDRNRFDKNVSHKNKAFRQLIKRLASVCEVGIHPSYHSNQKPRFVQLEKERLENIIQKPVTRSRQHYLKLRFPETYQNLLKAGITDDYTMGFAGLAGFRAGTCTSFPFFDLSNNQCTELHIHPFQVMDVALKNYLQLSPEKAWLQIEEIIAQVKKVNGTFISLWHNESLKDSGAWLGWQEVFEKIQKEGLKLENDDE